jgi:FkbM family methyltransferase
MGTGVRRVGAELRHAAVARMPSRARETVSAWPVPSFRQFTVPLPGGDSLRLSSPASHRMLRGLYWEGARSYEPSTVRAWWCLAQDAAEVADVGAFFGYYTLLAAKASQRAAVHAFEPLAEAAGLVRELAELNGCGPRIRVHEVALGSRAADAELRLPEPSVNPLPTVGSTVDRFVGGGPPSAGGYVSRTVRMAALDSVLGPDGQLDLVKLDAEGAELHVLAGARQTLEASRPDIITEVVIDQSRPPEVVAWLAARGYRIFDLTPKGPVPVEVASLSTMRNLRRSGTHRYGEVLASTRSDSEISVVRDRMTRLSWPD